MKRFTLFLCLILGYNALSFAQETEKIKGDRNLSIKQTYVDDFNTIVLGEDFEVELFYNKKASVEIETDDNLHAYIDIKVVDSVLTLTTTAEIKPKKLGIKVNYGDNFAHIKVKDNAEVRSLTSLELNDASLSLNGSSRAYLNIKAKDFIFTSNEKTKVKLNLVATNVTAQFSDNTKVDALVYATDAKFDLYQRANADIEGTIKNLALRSDNNAKFNGKNFTSNTCSVLAEMDTDIYVDVTESITIEASGASEIYLFGTPKITINKFLDTVKLQKKEK